MKGLSRPIRETCIQGIAAEDCMYEHEQAIDRRQRRAKFQNLALYRYPLERHLESHSTPAQGTLFCGILRGGTGQELEHSYGCFCPR